MSYRMIGRFLGKIILIETVFMVPALVISMCNAEFGAVRAFVITIVVTLLAGGILTGITRGTKEGFRAREGLVCVGISWMVLGLFGALPFFLSGSIPNYIDALFEIVSGFTTTGASILPEVESLPYGILYWRSFSHWLGGMGVLVFLLAVTTGDERSKGFTMHLLRAESPGPKVGKLVPRMKETAEILYLMYILLTVLNIVFLLIGRMPVFDAVCTAFGTAGTGGFGVKNDSIAGYSPYIQNVCTVFMLFFGVNFSCYYMLLLRQVKNVFKDEELRTYLGIVLGSIVLIMINLRGYYSSFGEALRHVAFQVASIVTTTGFATTDFDLWPSFSKSIMLCLMLLGACAGSTGGGFKCGRALLIIKGLRKSVRQIIHPARVGVIRVNDRVTDEKVMENTNAYLAAYALMIVVSFLLISVDGFSITTNLSAVISCVNNIGPGLEAVGPTCNFSGFSMFSKLVLIMDMLAGRLEIFPILILFSRSTWKNR
ncbi:MAG: TrkH family potassium uptake protein [bacterium]|nr:TrkH family potassium uptake protein [bacterium]